MEIVYSHANKTVNDNGKLRFTNIWRNRIRPWYIIVYAHFMMALTFLTPLVFLALCLIPLFWPFALLYIFWMFYDRMTPHCGGRRLQLCRKLTCWEFVSNYFPVKMVKTADLRADRNYIFGTFPHGVLSYGMACNIMSDVNGFDQAYPGLNAYAATLNSIFYFPVLRDVALLFGVIAASTESIMHVLNGPPGNICIIVVGGVREALKSTAGTNKIVLRNRKGFVRLALKTGTSLVPVFSFGETNTYRQPQSKLYAFIQEKAHSKLKVPFIIMKGRGPFRESISATPYKRPITTVIGSPIEVPKIDNPNKEVVNKYHQIFISELEQLFNKFKGKYDEKGDRATLEIE